MTDLLFPDDFDETASLGGDDFSPVWPGGVRAKIKERNRLASTPFALTLDGADRSLAERLGEVINVKDYGAGTGDNAADTAAIVLALAAGIAAPGAPHLYFPPGTYGLADAVLQIVDDYALLFGEGATIVFYGSAAIQSGTDADVVSQNEFRDLAFRVDSSSTAPAPIDIHAVGLTRLSRCVLHDIKAAGIAHRKGVVHLRHCDLRMSLTAGVAGIASAIPTGMTGAIFMQGGRGSCGNNANRSLITQTGAGTLDGCVLQGVQTTQLDHVLVSTPASGGRLSNMLSQGGMYDQVDQEAFKIAPAAGASVADVTLRGNKVNGSGGSTATSGALVSIDLTSGATHDADKSIIVVENALGGARNRAIECLGGSFGELVVSRNDCTDYGRRANVASRAIYITGTFGLLEVVDNTGVTSRTHDYDIELVAITATQRKVEGNAFGGVSPANLAPLNNALLRTRREVLAADRTYYIRTDGSDSNAGLVNSAAGAFLTLQGAYAVIGWLDFNGHTVTLQIGDGTYTAGLNVSIGNAPCPVGSGLLIIQGNAATPANVLISTTAVQAMTFQMRHSVRTRVKDFKLQTTTSGNALEVAEPIEVQFENVEFGACAGVHLSATNGGRLFARNAYAISGAAVAHAKAFSGGAVLLSARAVTITGTPAITNFYSLSDAGRIEARATTYSAGITGTQYALTGLSLLDAGGGAASIPGGTTGTAASGSQVI